MSNCWGVDGSQKYPGSFSPWSKEKLGWANIIDASSSGTIELGPVQNTGDIFKITRGYPANEYLLVESRSNDAAISVWDSRLPPGIYVYHIDSAVTSGNNEQGYPGDGYWPQRHTMVRMIQKDGLYHMEKNQYYNYDSGDAYNSGYMSDFSEPSLLSYEQTANNASGADCHITGNILSDFVFSNTGTSSFSYVAGDSSRSCEYSDGTFVPTKQPSTKAPLSVSPTEAPVTRSPTKQPSTMAPVSFSPTSARATVSPTGEPTTKAPSSQPSTKYPTGRPTTGRPTKRPSTGRPTTERPTKRPSTVRPSKHPTPFPTRRPSTARPTPTEGVPGTMTGIFNYCQRKSSEGKCVFRSRRRCFWNTGGTEESSLVKTLPVESCFPVALRDL